MSVKYILYNPLSCNGKGTELAQKLTDIYKDDELKYDADKRIRHIF